MWFAGYTPTVQQEGSITGLLPIVRAVLVVDVLSAFETISGVRYMDDPLDISRRPCGHGIKLSRNQIIHKCNCRIQERMPNLMDSGSGKTCPSGHLYSRLVPNLRSIHCQLIMYTAVFVGTSTDESVRGINFAFETTRLQRKVQNPRHQQNTITKKRKKKNRNQ
ncbi:hypothetical protein BDD12DRAFT_171792 [Trichophaea hybrida]|nr:hypothetical protein BDD12DRAFT_171792 [Trichophaea hybrida]